MRAFARLSSPLDDEFTRELMTPILLRDFRLFYTAMMDCNRAHTVMLHECGILSKEDAKLILSGLATVQDTLTGEDLREGIDLYFNVEQRLRSIIGPAAGKMHTGRSRNDLQACYQRIAVRSALLDCLRDVLGVREALLTVAAAHVDSVMPGYTHGQPAQPITFGHYLVGVHDSFARDWERLRAAWARTNHSPLGAGALATTSHPINRARTAELLGFDGVLENSLDAVASRDYVMEVLAACVGAASTASRLSTDLITWSAWEYRFVEIADGFASGSSIMPQKKNPLALEHTRAKLAHILAAYTSVVTLTKGLSFTHSRDTGSESWHFAFDGLTQTGQVARILSRVLATLTVHTQRMALAADAGYSTATELADTLVRRCDLPFRTAHEIVAGLVAKAIAADSPPTNWTANDVMEAAHRLGFHVSQLTDDDVRQALDPVSNVSSRCVQGGPSPDEVHRMLANRRKALERDREILDSLTRKITEASAYLEQRVRELTA